MSSFCVIYLRHKFILSEIFFKFSSLILLIWILILLFNCLNEFISLFFCSDFVWPQKKSKSGKSGKSSGHNIGPPLPIPFSSTFCSNMLLLYWINLEEHQIVEKRTPLLLIGAVETPSCITCFGRLLQYQYRTQKHKDP